MNNTEKLQKKYKMYKERVNENIDMILDDDVNEMEKMCAFLRAIDTLSQLFVGKLKKSDIGD